jgi:hypothetical protein
VITVRLFRCFALVLLASALNGAPAVGQDTENVRGKQDTENVRAKQDTERVRARQPTTVTVHGRVDPVDPERSAQEGGVEKRSGVARALAKTWNGIVSFGGWLLDKDDVIPSERERRERSGSESDEQKR